MSATVTYSTTDNQHADSPKITLDKLLQSTNAGGGGGGGGGISLTHGAAADPNGSVTGNVGDLYRSSIALGGDGSLWSKRTGNGTNTGWE